MSEIKPYDLGWPPPTANHGLAPRTAEQEHAQAEKRRHREQEDRLAYWKRHEAWKAAKERGETYEMDAESWERWLAYTASANERGLSLIEECKRRDEEAKARWAVNFPDSPQRPGGLFSGCHAFPEVKAYEASLEVRLKDWAGMIGLFLIMPGIPLFIILSIMLHIP